MMTLAEFTDGLDRFGADLNRWPHAEQAAARALLAQGPGAAWKHYRAALFVEQCLQSQPAQGSGKNLSARILAATENVLPDGVNVSFGAIISGWTRGLAAASFCVALLGGLWTGWTEQSDYLSLMQDVPGLTSSPGDWSLEP